MMDYTRASGVTCCTVCGKPMANSYFKVDEKWVHYKCSKPTQTTSSGGKVK